MKMISMSDNNSSSEEEDSQELQRLKDAAVTLEPDGDLHASQKVSTNSNEEANSTKVSQSRRSSRPSLRPKQTYSVDSGELKMKPGFKTHVAKKLSDILDKELEFSESVVEKCSGNKSSDSGIRLLSSSKDFLSMDPNAEIPKLKIDPSLEIPKLSKWSPVWKPKSNTKRANSTGDKRGSSTSRKRVNPSSNRQTNSSGDKYVTSTSDSSEDEMLAEAAVSFQDIKKKDELLSSFSTSSAPILIIRAVKDKAKIKYEIKSDIEVEAKTNENPVKKEKKRKKKKKKENSLEEENEDREKELTRKNKKNELCSGNNSLENNEVIRVKKKMKHEKDNNRKRN